MLIEKYNNVINLSSF